MPKTKRPKRKLGPLKTILIFNYPETFNFTTRAKLPKFKYGCRVRGALLVRAMTKQNLESPGHHYTDYVVETIRVYGSEQNEVWELGS